MAGGDVNFSFFQLYGDVNLDRSVGFADLVALAQHYGKSGETYAHGDVSGDGEVGFADLVAIAQNYGKSLIPPVPSQPVSAPAPAMVAAASISTATSGQPKRRIPFSPSALLSKARWHCHPRARRLCVCIDRNGASVRINIANLLNLLIAAR